ERAANRGKAVVVVERDDRVQGELAVVHAAGDHDLAAAVGALVGDPRHVGALAGGQLGGSGGEREPAVGVGVVLWDGLQGPAERSASVGSQRRGSHGTFPQSTGASPRPPLISLIVVTPYFRLISRSLIVISWFAGTGSSDARKSRPVGSKSGNRSAFRRSS